MDATIIGAVLAFAGVASGSVVAFIGKRGETATQRFNSEIDQVQEERDGLLKRLADRDTQIINLQEQRNRDLETITRLRIKVIQLGGDPDQ